MALTPEEVEQLRRLHVLSEFGELPAPMQSLFSELRARDTSIEILAPILDVQFVPRQRSLEDALDNLLNLADLEASLEAQDDADGSYDLDEAALELSSIRFVSEMFRQ
jgi:hypothetical protein